MRPPRGLSAGEAALWRRLAETVTPLDGMVLPAQPSASSPAQARKTVSSPATPSLKRALPGRASIPPTEPRDRNLADRTLDGSWERKLAKAQLAPDFEIDLHGHGLDAAYDLLMARLSQAIASGARVVLVIAGKPRPNLQDGFGDHAARGNRRGAIRAKLLDWLAASPHAGRIAAVRPAAQRHGGAGAVYVVLRRPSRA
jgi:DNA-nicking Smr family endonuclease